MNAFTQSGAVPLLRNHLAVLNRRLRLPDRQINRVAIECHAPVGRERVHTARMMAACRDVTVADELTANLAVQIDTDFTAEFRAIWHARIGSVYMLIVCVPPWLGPYSASVEQAISWPEEVGLTGDDLTDDDRLRRTIKKTPYLARILNKKETVIFITSRGGFWF